MNFGWDMALLFQSCVTALTSGANAFYLLVYHGLHRRRRWAAFALMLISLAFLVQSLYLGLLPRLAGVDSEILAPPRLRFIVGALPMLASLLVLSFILRRCRWWRR